MPQEKNTIEEYDAILKEVRGLMVAKNADYGDSWREMRLPSITDQILVKAYRIRSIEESEGSPKVSEGIESEYRDILNYCAFALIKLRDEKNGMSEAEQGHLQHLGPHRRHSRGAWGRALMLGNFHDLHESNLSQ